MSIPGFTAKASIYKTSASYRTRASSSNRTALVHPEILHCIIGCYKECIDLCRSGLEGNVLACEEHCTNRCCINLPPPPPQGPKCPGCKDPNQSMTCCECFGGHWDKLTNTCGIILQHL